MLDFAAGQRDHAWWRGMPITLGGCGDGQEGVRQHGQRRPPVPRGPAADLVLIQAAQPLGGLEGFLDPPALPGDPDQGGQRPGGTCWANAVAVVGGPQRGWSTSAQLTASTEGIRWVSSQERSLGLPP